MWFVRKVVVLLSFWVWVDLEDSWSSSVCRNWMGPPKFRAAMIVSRVTALRILPRYSSTVLDQIDRDKYRHNCFKGLRILHIVHEDNIDYKTIRYMINHPPIPIP